MTSSQEALERLIAGNSRFVAGDRDPSRVTLARREALAEGQAPFAAVLGCADSRVPFEIVFDQGLGDLFAVRVAGNIATPTQVGSVEFAVHVLGTPLVVVLGHTGCGAIQATIDAVEAGTGGGSDGLDAIVDCIRPVVLATRAEVHDPDELVQTVTRANVHTSIEELGRSEILKRRMANGELAVVGAQYAVDSGVVEFFDGVPLDPV